MQATYHDVLYYLAAAAVHYDDEVFCYCLKGFPKIIVNFVTH